jgi:hypothetical protein
MDLTVKVGYLIKCCMKLRAVISQDNYYANNINKHTMLQAHLTQGQKNRKTMNNKTDEGQVSFQDQNFKHLMMAS